MSISSDNDTSSTGAVRFTEDASSEEVLSGREESPEPSLGKHAAALPASLETNRISKRTAAATRRAVRGNVAHRNKKAHRRSRLFATLIALALIGFAAAIFVFVVVPKITDTVNPTQEITSGEEVTVVIPEGANASTVADILYTNKVIANKAEFLAQLKKQQSDQKIKSGTYLITTGMSYADIIRLLAEGPRKLSRSTMASQKTIFSLRRRPLTTLKSILSSKMPFQLTIPWKATCSPRPIRLKALPVPIQSFALCLTSIRKRRLI